MGKAGKVVVRQMYEMVNKKDAGRHLPNRREKRYERAWNAVAFNPK